MITQTEEHKEVARDIADLIGSMTKSYIPDYDTPLLQSSEGQSQKAQKVSEFISGWGGQMMRPASWIMESVATSRSKIFRRSLFELIQNGKLQNLVNKLNALEGGLTKTIARSETQLNYNVDAEGNLIEGKFKQEDLVVPDPMMLERVMKEAKISRKKYGRMVTYLLQSGFLDAANFTTLVDVVTNFNDHSGKGTYSTGGMYNRLTKTVEMEDRARYHQIHDVIGGLRMMEKSYIQEILVNPNAFDISTEDGRADRIFEIFRRYGVLFNSQLVFRNSNHLNITAMGARVTSMLVLDMMYMMLLRIANGDSWDDILEDVEEDPIVFFLKYGSRLPIMGRYLGFMAESVMYMVDDSPWKRSPGAFISVGGALSIAENLKNLISVILSGEATPEDFIMALKFAPFIGDSIPRGAAMAIMGNEGEVAKASEKGAKASLAGMNANPAYFDSTMEDWLTELYKTFAKQNPNWQSQKFNDNIFSGIGKPQSPSEALEPPVQPVEDPQVQTASPAAPAAVGGPQAAPKVDPIAAIKGMKPDALPDLI